MIGLKNLKIRTKMLVLALLIGLIPLLTIGGFAWLESRNALSKVAFNQLESVREIKTNQIASFFQERKSDLQVLVEMVNNVNAKALKELKLSLDDLQDNLEMYFQERFNNVRVLSENQLLVETIIKFETLLKSQEKNGQFWDRINEKLGGEFALYRDKYGYNDVFLINPKDGHVMYTAKGGMEFNQVLSHNALLKNSGLDKVVKKAVSTKSTVIQDFEPYAPANHQAVAFMATPVFKSGEIAAVVVLSILPDAIYNLMETDKKISQSQGQDKIGEAYLVAEWNNQITYRSHRHFSNGKQAVVGDPIIGKKKAALQGLAGESGVNVRFNHLNELELIGYVPLKIHGLKWTLLSVVSWEKELIPKIEGSRDDFFAKYIHAYKYYDLFLIHPQGEIFYTVGHESDYHTNILTGKYADSGLGKVVRKTLKTKKFAMSDFAPYEPSNGEPAAFIAQALLDKNGKVEMVIALQLSDKAISDIMQERTGMGKTGESYLVGSDMLMRSNSFLDPDNHSIKASFANPIRGAINTEATRAAIERGETGEKIILDYRGEPVLSAYTPLKIADTTWAVIAEIDEAEAFASIQKLEWLLGGIALLAAFVTIILINYSTQLITTPLSLLNQHFKILAKGKLVDDDVKYQAKDEIGELVKSARLVKEGFKNSIEQANAIASGNYNSEIKLLSNEDQLGRALSDMTLTLRETTAKNAEQDWLKTGQALLSNEMSGEKNITKLAKDVITTLTTYLDGEVGLLYVMNETDEDNDKPYLRIIATYAYTDADYEKKFWVGEGLIGQAALEKKTISRAHTPDEYTHIVQSSLAMAVPHHVIISPFLYEGDVKGVVEIGFAEKTTQLKDQFVELVLPSLGIAVNTAEARTRQKILLEQTQKLAKDLEEQKDILQAQQQELQQSNEELQSQSEELQSQSEELQAQQEELRQVNEELEERTKALEIQQKEIVEKNDALQESQFEMEKAKSAIELKAKELELASKYKSEFLANMSHELRTPLNSLLILAQLLAGNKGKNLTDKQVQYAQTIHSAGSDLLTLINEILDLSKVEAGKIDIQPEDISISELVTTLEQKFSHVAENKNLEFQVNIDKELPATIYTDGQRLNQIINNQLSNAFKFTSEGGITIRIGRPSEEDNLTLLGLTAANSIAISVTDTGIGIKPEKQQQIFEAFQQEDGSTSRRFGGTGLGLSISRQLARLLGGDLVLHSEEGKGSTFTLLLPERVEIKKPTEESVEATAETQPETPPQQVAAASVTVAEVSQAPNIEIKDDRDDLKSGDKVILIVEDDQKFSSVLVELAREKRFKVLLAEDGKTGLEMAKQYKPQAIILDVGLPQLDGWTVMEHLKDNPETRHIPVHFMSANEEDGEAKQMGAIGYLHKPVSMDMIGQAFKKIERFLSKSVKKLLIVVDNDAHQKQIIDLVGEGDVEITVCKTKADAIQKLQKIIFECIIIDVDAEDKSALELLEQTYQDENLSQIPVIIHSKRDLSEDEEKLLQHVGGNITIKEVHSPERLLDEATLFLHQVESNLPEDKQEMLRQVHDKEAIFKGKNVLIVDDDVRNTFALMTVLEEKNMEVVVGNNGKEALEILDEQSNIDMVLMDIMMPEMDGYEAIAKIREQSRFRHLPIIALTAKAMKGDKIKCIEAGANDYLAKPVDTDKLLSMMRVWLYR
jgi:CheY-like chemotaxis protein/signal transduction histidine kinase